MNSQATTLTEDKLQQTLQLADGRLLSYAEYGDLAGQPLFFFHGGNDSRLEAAILDETAQKLGVRIIAPDRPGYGRSTFQAQRTFLDWPNDIAQLADALGIVQFAVAGHSGGGPHAAVVAYGMPERLTSVTLISSAAPPGSSNKGMHPLVSYGDQFFHGIIAASCTAASPSKRPFRCKRRRKSSSSQWGRMSPADGRLFQSRPAVQEMIAAEMQEALHQGIDAILQEHSLYKQPWGIELTAIALPVHHLAWTGRCPGRSSLERLPRCPHLASRPPFCAGRRPFFDTGQLPGRHSGAGGERRARRHEPPATASTGPLSSGGGHTRWRWRNLHLAGTIYV
jgi:pimeloyl-ACP methyl ester carboxylesterase